VRLAHSDPRLCAHPDLRDTDILQSTTSQTTRYLYHLSTTCKLMIDEIGDAWSPAPIRTATRCRTARAPGRSSRRGHVYCGDSTSVPLRYPRILHHRAAAPRDSDAARRRCRQIDRPGEATAVRSHAGPSCAVSGHPDQTSLTIVCPGSVIVMVPPHTHWQVS